jgi:hypothetical protein
MNEERITIQLVVSLVLWLGAVILAFYYVGALVGIIVILAGLAGFGWWLARLIGSEPEAPE